MGQLRDDQLIRRVHVYFIAFQTAFRHLRLSPHKYKMKTCISLRSQHSQMATVTSVVLAKPLLKTACTLGEGPLYDPSTAVLHFVDIENCQVGFFNPPA